MARWNSSQHSIADIREWFTLGRLELKPDFQRRPVWSAPAKIMLMDSILKGIPIPKVFLSNQIKDEKTYRIVIDGQQRIRAILDFIGDKYRLNSPFEGPNSGYRFSELERDVKDDFLNYQIDFNEALNPTEEEIRDVYSRVNKYTFALNKQELRIADFPGDFCDLSEKLASDDFFSRANIFTPASLRRYSDVEFISELLMALAEGVKSKKGNLDSTYAKYSHWDSKHKNQTEKRFNESLRNLDRIFDKSLPIYTTRFRQKSDFYSLFLAVDKLLQEGYCLSGEGLKGLRDDLKLLSKHIRPESRIEAFMEYAVKCVSSANTSSSRKWRQNFIYSIISPAYKAPLDAPHTANLFYKILTDLNIKHPTDRRTKRTPSCEICNEHIDVNSNEALIAWKKSASCHHLSNSFWLHTTCIADQNDFILLSRPSKNEQLDFL